MYETIELIKEGRQATLTLNRPTAMNAMDFTMMRELADCFESLHEETDVQLLIIRGAGKVFSAGGDVKMMASSDNLDDFGDIMSDITRIVKAYYTLPMLTVAHVHGAAAGLGLSVALGSDFLIAEESTIIAMNFIGIGLVPDGGGHFFMEQRLGTHKAKQQIWEGKVMSGKEAKELGLVDKAVVDGTIGIAVQTLTKKLLAAPVAAMLETKALLHAENLPKLERILQAESEAQQKMRKSKDHLEGITAFIEKRTPAFVGK